MTMTGHTDVQVTESSCPVKRCKRLNTIYSFTRHGYTGSAASYYNKTLLQGLQLLPGKLAITELRGLAERCKQRAAVPAFAAASAAVPACRRRPPCSALPRGLPQSQNTLARQATRGMP